MSAERGPLAEVQAAKPLDSDRGLTYFDDLQGAEQEAEPGREIPIEQPDQATPAVRSLDPALAPPEDVELEDGPFYIQVFAGRDRSSAEELVGRLQSGGYRVRLFSERDGPGSLFKVRVGGYPSDARAREISEELKTKGYSGAWVARSD
jgi:cell division septation protein DedD